MRCFGIIEPSRLAKLESQLANNQGTAPSVTLAFFAGWPFVWNVRSLVSRRHCASSAGGPVIINENTTPSLIYRLLGPGASDSQADYFLHLLRMNEIKDTHDVDAGLWASLVSQAFSIE